MGHEIADRMLYRRLLRLARPFARPLALLFALELIDGLWVVLTPLPLKIVVDNVLGSRPLPGFLGGLAPPYTTPAILLIVAVGLLLSIALVSNVHTLGVALLRGFVGERLVLGFRGQLFHHAQRLSLAYHDEAGTADTNYRIQKDAASVENIIIDIALPLAAAVGTVILMFAVTLWLDWQLGLVAGIVLPLLLIVSARSRRRLRQQAREVKKLESGALGIVHEVLAALRVVKAFGQEPREHERFLHHSHIGMRARLRLVLAQNGYGMAIRLTIAAGTAAVLFLGAQHVQQGALTLGELLLVLGYLALVYDPLKTISRKAGGLQGHLASTERAFALLDQRPDVVDRPDGRPLSRATGALAFVGVTFCYDVGRPVLRDLSLELAPGARLGIVGATGAGKTTLLNLLLRFYDPTAGHIRLDGIDLRDYRVADVRNQFALVLQDAVLFSASIAENIAYARPDTTRAEIEAAATAACAHDFIVQLPDGYDTRVGERGMRLSGGERQRIAIARAFLKDAPILLLDEPTSAVDGATEANILEAMERLMIGRTSILITHRQAPLAACDSVLALHQGRLLACQTGAGAS
jgi:ATP-binding cassette subfamily B protein